MYKQLYANIIIDVSVEALNKCFIFKISEDLIEEIKVGDKVVVPFGIGNKDREGYVIEILTEEQLKNKEFYKREEYFRSTTALDDLKYIIKKSDKKIGVTEILLKMAIYLCKEYKTPLATCINTVMPIKQVVRKNVRQKDVIDKYEIDEIEKTEKNNIILNDEQRDVVEKILSTYKNDDSNTNNFVEHLIYGVTGSGKTEVYIKVIEEVLNRGKQVIVLIPEIALTFQTVLRLKEKFEDNIAIIHSRMSKGERYIQYKKCEDGEAKILVGPRSAIFAPFDNLGLVVIDEVQDTSYKSDSAPRYNVIDVARYRCNLQNAMLLTLSATPTISLYNEAIEKKRDNIYCHKLINRAKSYLPKVILVDMKKELREGNHSPFSKILEDSIRDRLRKKEQIMLYINRRGYDRTVTCAECGKTIMCPHCDVALTSHNDGVLRCHYCDYEMKEPMVCPSCESSKLLKFGMGTEKLEEKCIDLFPEAKVLRMDFDTTHIKDGHDKIIEKFRKHKADILIGTQMIVKGHDFPLVTLVAIMCADMSLCNQTYKATENTFQILTQCVGRSGRDASGVAIIQGYDIDNFVIKHIEEQDFEKFYNEEIVFRKKLFYPPFSKLLYICVRSSNEDYLIEKAKNLGLFLNTRNEYKAIILGPTKASPYKIKDVYNMMFYIKCSDIKIAKIFRNLADNYVKYNKLQQSIKIYYDIE